jgi:hypothetical protein
VITRDEIESIINDPDMPYRIKRVLVEHHFLGGYHPDVPKALRAQFELILLTYEVQPPPTLMSAEIQLELFSIDYDNYKVIAA